MENKSELVEELLTLLKRTLIMPCVLLAPGETPHIRLETEDMLSSRVLGLVLAKLARAAQLVEEPEQIN